MKSASASEEKEDKSAAIKRSSFSVCRTRIARRTTTLATGLRPSWCFDMRTVPILQLVLLLMVLAVPSEEFFFEHPKKALMEWFQSLKGKKQPPKTNIQHYHVHYYPIPVPALTWRAPDKRDLEKLYDDTLRSFGWLNHQYKYIPDPSIIIPSGLQQLWTDFDPVEQEIVGTDDVDTIDRSNKGGILVQVPVGQQLVFHLLRKSRKQATSPRD